MEVFDDSQKLEIACAHHFVGISGKSEWAGCCLILSLFVFILSILSSSQVVWNSSYPQGILAVFCPLMLTVMTGSNMVLN